MMPDNPFRTGKATLFQKADAPRDEGERKDWQDANRTWWEQNPMRYDFLDTSIEVDEFTVEFYREVDRRFFSTVKMAFPWKTIPFDNFIDFRRLGSLDVLEIGVGMGTHAEILSRHARSYTGIDLTDYAVNATRKRLDLFEQNGLVQQMDAEKLDFPDSSFDMVWS